MVTARTLPVVTAAWVVLAVLLAGAVNTGCDGDVEPSTTEAATSSTGEPPRSDSQDVVDPARGSQATRLVTLLSEGMYAEVEALFDEQMQAALPAAKLEGVWTTVQSQAGTFQRVGDVTLVRQQGYDVAFVTTEFAQTALEVKVVFDPAGKVAGLFFVPTGSGAAADTASVYEAPDYVDQAAFQEEEVTVGAPGWPLPGTLSLPTGDGPFPGVVLVHGSGPNDRDESIGPNKPFRDVAWGLASRGIAVLRYEKRTLEHQEKLADTAGEITVEEETVADVVAALSALRARPEIDPDRVFVLGHSLGGYLAPRIAERDPSAAGAVLLAAAARPLEDLILEQTIYLAELDGSVSPEEQQTLDDVRAAVDRVKDASLSPSTDAALLPLGIPAAYWLDLRDYDPVETAAGLDLPFLVLQGGRDYQVTTDDFSLWQVGLEGGEEDTFILYDDLNHLFLTGTGQSGPAEYEVAGHVDVRAIDDLSGWIGR